MRTEARRLLQCTPEDFLDLVMDPDRYAAIDNKLSSVRWVHRWPDERTVDFAFRPLLPGLGRLPMPTVVVRMHCTPGRRVDSGYAPAPYNRVARRASVLRASFTARATDAGTEVVRTETFAVRWPLRGVVDRILARTLQRDLQHELAGAAALLGPPHVVSGGTTAS